MKNVSVNDLTTIESSKNMEVVDKWIILKMLFQFTINTY
jgi:hypothetical protein